VTSERTVYHCGGCDKEFETHAVADHMSTVHGCTIGPIPGADECQKPPVQAPAHQIVRKLYRHIEPDNSVATMATHVCPCCQLEFQHMRSLVAHMLEAHQVRIPFPDDAQAPEQKRENVQNGVEISGNGQQQRDDDPSTVKVVRLTWPGGVVRLECPLCQAQFPEDSQAAFLDHVSFQHGRCWGFEAGGPGHAASDNLDRLYQGSDQLWHPQRDVLLERFHVISLGHFCGVKFSIQNLGLGNAHLPFDWIRTTSAGLRHFLRNDFEGYFSVATRRDVRCSNLRMYRSKRHSFWHDDIAKAEVRAKLQRRMDRFLALRDDPKDIMFVRNVAFTDELSEVEDLYAALCEALGGESQRRRVFLVVVVDGQECTQGPIRHSSLPGVLFYGQMSVNSLPAERQGQAYCRVISSALDLALATDGFALGDSTASSLPEVACASDLLTDAPGLKAPFAFFSNGLFTGYDNLRSFSEQEAEHFDMCTTGLEELPVLGDDEP